MGIPSTITFPANQTSITVPVTAIGPGTATVFGFAPNLTGFVNIVVNPICTNCVTIANVSVGNGLEVSARVATAQHLRPMLQRCTSSAAIQQKLEWVPPPQVHLDVRIGTGSSSGGVLVQGFANSGTVTLTATAPNLSAGAGRVTLSPGGFVLSSPNGIGKDVSVAQGTQADLTVSAERLECRHKIIL